MSEQLKSTLDDLGYQISTGLESEHEARQYAIIENNGQAISDLYHIKALLESAQITLARLMRNGA